MQIDGGGKGAKRGRGDARRILFPKKKARQVVPALRGMKGPRVEIKSVDTVIDPANMPFDSSATRVTVLNLMTQGTALQNHVGRKVSLKNVSIRWNIIWSQNPTAYSSDFMRILLVYDRQPNAAVPALGDVLQDCNPAGTTQSIAYSGLNISNADRFKILRDTQYAVSGAYDAGAGGITSPSLLLPQVVGDISRPSSGKWFVNLKGLETHFNGTNGGTIADITTGSLLLFTTGLQTSANAQFALQGQARVRFVDL